jgi:predicted phosphoribosyltransferase
MFIDRKEAAVQLAKALEKYKDRQAVVLGIPRGGAVTGYYVASYLHAEFTLLISRKLGHPANPEYAIGAITEDGTIHMNKSAAWEASQEQIDRVILEQKREIQRRIRILRKGEPLPILKDKIVLLVDDGIATGATLYAAIEMCRKQQAAQIVVAAPVAGESVKKELEKVADEVIILETPAFYHAVSQVYEYFEQVSDEEAVALLERWKKDKLRLEKPKA